jgi:hypothetical protein
MPYMQFITADSNLRTAKQELQDSMMSCQGILDSPDMQQLQQPQLALLLCVWRCRQAEACQAARQQRQALRKAYDTAAAAATAPPSTSSSEPTVPSKQAHING